MRKFIFIVLCIAAVLMSCNNEDQQQTIFGDGFAISIDTSKTLEFSPVGERVEFSLTSGIPLVVTRNKTWMEISIDGKKIENDRMDIKPGHHNIVLIVRCAPCLDPQQMSEGTFEGEESRECEIKILKDSNHMVTMLKIEQKYPYLYFDKVGCSTEYKWTWADKYDESGYYESYEIKSNIKWKVSIGDSSSQTINFIELSKENKGVDVDLNMITRTTVLLGEHWEANVANGENDKTFSIAPCNYNFTSDPHQCRITISDITDSKEITPLTIDCTQTNLKFIVSQKDSNGDYQEIENGGELLETVEPCQPSSKEIKVESEGGLSWAFSFDKDWVSLKDNNEKNVEGDQVNADKTYTLYAHINTNDDRKDRDSYGTFTITANGATVERKFKLTQAAFEHDVIDNNSNTVKTVSFSNMGEVQLSNDQKIYMNSSGSWECGPITYKTDTKDWLTVNPTESDKRGEKTELSLSVANQNPELKSRQAIVSFNSNDNALKSELAITQAPFIFELGSGSSTRPDVITKDDTEEKIVTLKTSGDWSAEVDKDWLTVDPEGQKNENGVSIPYSVSVNTGADERNATITIKSKYHEENNGFRELYSPIEVVIRQNGSFVVDKNAQTLSFGAFDNLSHTVNVKCLAPDGWKATYPKEWLSVSPSSTKDDDINVTLTANNNSLFKSRAGSVVFTMWDEGEKKDKTRTVYVEQSAYVFEVSDIDNFGDNTNIPAYNTNGYVCYAMDIECSGKWRANVSQGVAVLSRTNNYGTSLTYQVGDGTGEHLYIFVKNNNNEQPRDIQVSIVCDGDSTDGKNTKTFTATQLKYDFSVSTKIIDEVEAEVKEGDITRSFTITCPGEWRIDCGEDKDWLSVYYSGETSNKTTGITVYVEPNNTTNSRTGVVTIKSVDLNKSLTVKIKQQYVKFDAFASGLTFDAIPREAQQITINCTGSWKYDSTETEISAKIAPETGFGETDIKITPDPNYSFEDKKDKKIYFVNTLTKQTQYVSVTVNGYVLNVPNEIEVFGKDGEEREILVECSGIWDVKSADISWIEKCEKSSKDSKLVIKVSKNDTGKDREGTISIWAENNENLIREIKVKQTK